MNKAILMIPLLFALAFSGAGSTAQPSPPAAPATAIFAGGCFWCMEEVFEKVPGVLTAESGYIGGQVENPTYKQVSAGGTGHAEAVRVSYAPSKVSYRQLLDHFWRNIDPTQKDRQFCDIGNQYRSGIYYRNEAQRNDAESSKAEIETNGQVSQVHTEIAAAGTFYPAEEYHQDYYKKNPLRYKLYKWNCGREARLDEVWGKSR